MKKIFVSASRGADLSVIEGVMGLYDGGRGGVSSTAQIAKALRAPVLLVIDVRSMGESAAAIAKGFRDYDPEVNLCGVIVNRYGSDSHRAMVTEAIERLGIPVVGAVPRDKAAEVRERHLGLLPVEENDNREHIENVRRMTEPAIDFDKLLEIARSAPPLEEADEPRAAAPRVKIAVARDEAFSFYYPESLAALEAAGAEIITFSPLHDERIPECGGLIFGGGFPEIFAARLAANKTMKESIARAAADGMPIYAECGGFMYLTREIKDFEGAAHEMCGIIPMRCKMNDRLRTVGYVTAKSAARHSNRSRRRRTARPRIPLLKRRAARRNPKRFPLHQNAHRRNLPRRLRDRKHPRLLPPPPLRGISKSRGKVCGKVCGI